MTDRLTQAAEVICRATHPTRWEYRATSTPCDPCRAGAQGILASGLLSETTTEWGVLYEATTDTTLYEPRDSEAVARTETAASPTDTAVIRRDVTAWRRADARP